jgi:biopolymer transport protein ExbD/biopolymer transport protein TolR
MGSATTQSTNSEVADINITPMIDVLLVLLVIFIIVQMNMQRTFDIQLPVDDRGDQRPSILMEIVPGGVSVNTRSVPPAGLEAYLRDVYRNRPDKVIFVKAAPDVSYGEVIGYIDSARAAGVTVVGAVLSHLPGSGGTLQ